MLKPDPHRLAGSEGALRRREDKKPRAVLGRVGLVVHGPRQLLPVRAARQQDLVERLVARVDQVVFPRDVIAASLGKEVEVELHVLRIGDLGVAVRGHVLAPVILFLFLGRAALVPPAHFECQPDAGERAGAPSRVPSASVASASARGLSRWTTRIGSHSRRRKRASVSTTRKTARPTAKSSAQDHGRAIELEHADIAPAHRAPQRPVADPVDLIGERAITREAQDRQAESVGRVAILRDRVHDHHERRPDQDRRHQKQAPDQEERPHLQADLPLDQEGDHPGQRDRHDDRQSHRDHGHAFAQKERARADRRGVGDRGQPRRSFPLERLDRVEQQQQAEANGQDSHRADCKGPGRDQERRVEETHRRRAPCRPSVTGSRG